MALKSCFNTGQIVDHRKFAYRGVIIDVDPTFNLSDQWYEDMAISRPSKSHPWYHVLVDNSNQTTYVAERHLQPSYNLNQINHPLLGRFFKQFNKGQYIIKTKVS